MKTLGSLAHALSVAPSAEEALRALAEALAEVDRYAQLALITIDERKSLLRHRVLATPGGVSTKAIDTTLDHLPSKELAAITAGGQFVDLGESGDDYARLLQITALGEPGWLAIRGIAFEGSLGALLVVYEPKKRFGVRASERLAAAAALYELAYVRLRERDARMDAVHTLEDITRRVHDEYARKLAALEERLREASSAPPDAATTFRIVELERALAESTENGRRTLRRAEAVEATVTSAVAELEKAHVELHRRSEALRQKTRTLYLIDRVLTLDAGTDDPRQLADTLLSLIGDDMHAHRCSLMLRSSDGRELYLAASKGLAPGITEGTRVRMGERVSGRVALSRQPILVQDVEHANQHPLLRDEYFTTGSFISFPLIYRGDLIGVVNLSNRAQRGVFVEEDVDRVRLLGLVIALVASHARLADRLADALATQ